MLFKVNTLKEIKKGTVTVAFRKWKRPTVKEGGTLNTPIGQLGIDLIEPVAFEDITDADIKKAGYAQKDALEKLLTKRTGGTLYKISFHLKGEDPRIALRENTDLSDEEMEAILKKLQRLDDRGKYGAWTFRVMDFIKKNPGMRAADMAKTLEMEKDWLKPNIWKLKNLGLTISLGIGYRISPRGEVILKNMR